MLRGRFGCPNSQDYSSFFAVCSKGSMEDSLFNDYIERVVLPLYTNISKTTSFNSSGTLLSGPVFLKVDSGPGRMVASLESISKRAEFLEMGLILLMGLPNATSVHQEMDVLFEPFKSATDARGETVLVERIKEKGEKEMSQAGAVK